MFELNVVAAVEHVACVMVVFLVFAGQSREPFKIREQIKLEALDSAEEEGSALEKQSIAMASNSIFESFSSYQSCFTRGEYLRSSRLFFLGRFHNNATRKQEPRSRLHAR